MWKIILRKTAFLLKIGFDFSNSFFNICCRWLRRGEEITGSNRESQWRQWGVEMIWYENEAKTERNGEYSSAETACHWFLWCEWQRWRKKMTMRIRSKRTMRWGHVQLLRSCWRSSLKRRWLWMEVERNRKRQELLLYLFNHLQL